MISEEKKIPQTEYKNVKNSKSQIIFEEMQHE